jgi:transposase
MFSYTKAAMERAMKVQEVILRAMAKKITWYQAAEIIGISDRHVRRRRERYKEFGYDGLFDRRRGRPSPKRVPLAQVEQMLGLYRDRYPDRAMRNQHRLANLRQEIVVVERAREQPLTDIRLDRDVVSHHQIQIRRRRFLGKTQPQQAF